MAQDMNITKKNLNRADFILIFWAFFLSCSQAAAWGISEATLDDLTRYQMSYRSLTTLQDSVYGDSAGKNQKGLSSKSKSPLDLGVAGGLSSGGGHLSSDSKAADKLAASLYPKEDFVRQRIAIESLIKAFLKNAEKTYGVPPNNLATAMAVALAGSWVAYNDQPFKDEWVKPLVRQLDAAMTADPAIKSQSLGSKIYMHQLLTGVGLILMAEQSSLQTRTDPQKKSQLGKLGGEYLHHLLGVAPERVTFTSSGISIN